MAAPDLDPDLLRAFVAVADHRSFTKASAELNRTQSAVSMQVRRLEERLEVELLHRTTSSVTLSRQGETMLTYARRILALNEEVMGHLREQKIQGAVRIGVMEDYAMQVLPPMLARFSHMYPSIHLQLEAGLTSRMVEHLGDQYDLVVAMFHEGAGEGTFLRREQPVWASVPLHNAHELEPLPLALAPTGCLFRKWAIDALDKAELAWRLAFVSPSLGALEAFVRYGLAVTVVKAGTLPPTLRPVSPEMGLPSLPKADIRLLAAPRLSKAASKLREHLLAEFRTGPTATGWMPHIVSSAS